MTTIMIRDGLEPDIAACLKLDHTYETDYVWQMTVHQDVRHWQITFRTERLPRTLELAPTPDPRRLKLALPVEQCFLIAVNRDTQEILGYLTMRNDAVRQVALIQDLMISRRFRRQKIATRLISVAHQWAREHKLLQFTVETHTKNYPAIQFCQELGFTFCGFNDHYLPDQDIAVFFSQVIR